MKRGFKSRHWAVVYSSEDGGRLNRLRFRGIDLLTREPEDFRPPDADYGEYEKRPVYGYDDCFPTVDACTFPGREWMIPDHGELCWQPWQVDESHDRLLFAVESKMLPVRFSRDMHFEHGKLTWTFKVVNRGKEPLPFMHVMHPLMPLSAVGQFELPAFASGYDEIQQRTMDLKDAGQVRNYLLGQPPGTANMLLLRNVSEGRMRLMFKSGLSLQILFPQDLFPGIGIWWNNRGYPDEDGLRRDECAFEPIPGPTSALDEAFKSGMCLTAPPGKSVSWRVVWDIV